MNDVEVRLECVRLSRGEMSAREVYEFVTGGEDASENCDRWSSSEDWDQWSVGYDKGFECALDLVAQDVEEVEELDVEDEFDRGYLVGVRSALETLKEGAGGL